MIRKAIEKESCPYEYKKFIKHMHYAAEYVALFFPLKEMRRVGSMCAICFNLFFSNLNTKETSINYH